MAKKRQKKNRRDKDSTVKYIILVTAIFQLVRAVVDLIKLLAD